ncbi:MAG: hypothetical protein M3125_02295 [Gemmatimonadota bacterium]|nr:hypothetical protein [Gemmatimonadota bacterium]
MKLARQLTLAISAATLSALELIPATTAVAGWAGLHGIGRMDRTIAP